MLINEDVQQNATFCLFTNPWYWSAAHSCLGSYCPIVTGDPYSNHPNAIHQCLVSAPAHILGVCDLLHVDTFNPIRILPQLVDIKRQTNTLDLDTHHANQHIYPQYLRAPSTTILHPKRTYSHPSNKNLALSPPPPQPIP